MIYKYSPLIFVTLALGFACTSFAMEHNEEEFANQIEEHPTVELELIGLADMDQPGAEEEIFGHDFSGIDFNWCWLKIQQGAIAGVKMIPVLVGSQPVKSALIDTAFETALTTFTKQKLPSPGSITTTLAKNVVSETLKKFGTPKQKDPNVGRSLPVPEIAARWIFLVFLEKHKEDKYLLDALLATISDILSTMPKNVQTAPGKVLGKLLRMQPQIALKALKSSLKAQEASPEVLQAITYDTARKAFVKELSSLSAPNHLMVAFAITCSSSSEKKACEDVMKLMVRCAKSKGQ